MVGFFFEKNPMTNKIKKFLYILVHLIPDGHDEIPTFALYHPLLAVTRVANDVIQSILEYHGYNVLTHHHEAVEHENLGDAPEERDAAEERVAAEERDAEEERDAAADHDEPHQPAEDHGGEAMTDEDGEAEHDSEAENMDHEDSISDSIEDAINSAANIDDSDDNSDHLAPQSEYENIRDRNIAERQQRMNELFAEKTPAPKRKRKPKTSAPAPARKSARLADK